VRHFIPKSIARSRQGRRRQKVKKCETSDTRLETMSVSVPDLVTLGREEQRITKRRSTLSLDFFPKDLKFDALGIIIFSQ